MADPRYATIPFQEAIAYLREKINLGTDSWRDLRDDEHDAFFVVAGAKGSMLAELRSAVEEAIADGLRPEEFQERFEQIAEGWAYNGSAEWRSRLILQTNLRASYGRGREEYQLDPEVRRVMPYLQFVASDAVNPRPHHQALNGQVFTAETVPFPLPNGYGCGCRYTSLSQRQLDRRGLSLSTVSRGTIMADGMPLEPAPGWDKSMGTPRDAQRRELIQRVIDRSPPDIAAQVREDVTTYQRENVNG